MAQIQWFPGHMAKARREITEKLKLVDIVLEILDARVPISSRNPMMGEILKDKPTLVLLNKANLADKKVTLEWIEYFKNNGIKALDIDLIDNYNVNKIIPACNEVLAKEIEAAKAKGYSNFKIRALVVGIPNVGKSTFINTLAKRKAAVTGDKPGVTKSQTWIKINNSLELLDTPGILWPKFEDPHVGLNLAFCGSIKDEILDVASLALELIKVLQVEYPNELMTRYKLDELTEDALENMENISRKRGFILPGKRIDYERCGKTLLDEFRGGVIGNITLEKA